MPEERRKAAHVSPVSILPIRPGRTVSYNERAIAAKSSGPNVNANHLTRLFRFESLRVSHLNALDKSPSAHYNNRRWFAGAVAQRERASFARKRPGVRIPPAPPDLAVAVSVKVG